MKIIKTIVLLVLITVAVVITLKFADWNILNLFKAKPIVIDQTVNVIEKINRLAELTTATYYEDYAIVKKKTGDTRILGLKISDIKDELVLITKGKVRAGFDLSKLQEKDIIVDSVSITLKLPQVQIFDVITNPSDFETFEENGNWSHEEITEYKNEARAVIEQNALDNDIVKLAEKTGKEKLTLFMQAIGFEKVTIVLNNNNTQSDGK
jgi:hypothetical protein